MSYITTILEETRKGMEDNLYNFTKDGECSGCGNCCTNILPMSNKEYKAIKKYIEKNNIQEYKRNYPVAAGLLDVTCPFRNEDKGICTIYEVRPQICKSFICDTTKRTRMNRNKLAQTRSIANVRETFYGKENDYE